MLINILGGDGCGKSTQIARLLDWAPGHLGRPARLLAKKTLFDTSCFPACDLFGISYETLAHDRLPRMPAEARALWLLYMNMALIKGSPPESGELVFLDGYWQKHYATEAALGIDPDWLRAVGMAFPEPDLTLLLDVDPAVIVARGHDHKPYESGCDFACTDDSFLVHQRRVRSRLLALAEEADYVVVDADQDEQMVFSALCDLISARARTHWTRARSLSAPDWGLEPV